MWGLIRKSFIVDICALTAVSISGLCASPATFGQYEPPTDYYDSATGTAAVLKNQLHDIIDNHADIGYSGVTNAIEELDEDPAQPANILLIYNRDSVSPGGFPSVWNREHQWPRSRGIGDSGIDFSDCFNLRPCDSDINSTRSNKPYGSAGGFWNPGSDDQGDCARSMFYMAVRYDGSDYATTDLDLRDVVSESQLQANEMGDLSSLLFWHYIDPPDTFEKRRNHLIYSNYQFNRNPFIDHPEWVWTIFSNDHANDSKLYVGDTIPGDGVSSINIDLGTLQLGASPPDPVPVTLYRNGSDPTYYNVTASGVADTAHLGNNGFPNTIDTQTIEIGLTAEATDSFGVKTGTVVIDNLDPSNEGTGTGSLDGNDVITISVRVAGFADSDFDGDVDMQDFGEFQACLTGDKDHYGIYDPARCSLFDWDHDEDVDQEDYSHFQNCLSGPDIPYDQSCAN
jgi:endonuclease I